MSKVNTRATINANIKQNGNQEISGQTLNSVLNTMVDDYAEQEKLTELSQKVEGQPPIQINLSEYSETIGTIYATDNIFYNTGGFANHRVKIVPIGNYVGRTIKIVPGLNAPYNQFIATFLAQNVSVGSVVRYASGYAAPLNYEGEKTFLIPSDAQYLYFYITDIRTTTDYTPDSAEIVATSGEFYTRQEVDAITGELRENVGENTLENVSGYLVGDIVFIKQYSPRVTITEDTDIVVKRLSGVASAMMAVIYRNDTELYLTFTPTNDGGFLLKLKNGDVLDSIYLTKSSGGIAGDYFGISLKTGLSKEQFETKIALDSFEELVGDSRSESISAYKTGSITYIKEFSPHLITDKQTTIVAERNSGDAYEVLAVVKRGGSELYLRFTRVSENSFKFVTQAGDELLSFYIGGGAVGDTFTLKYLQGTFSDIWESDVKIESLENRVYRKSLNWIAIGDSLTDVQTLGAGVDNYVNLVAKTLGLNAINKGVSGTGYMNEQDVDKAFYQRIPNFTHPADVITIFGSFNDLGAGDLGTAEDEGTTTVGGCMNATISAITTKYPDALIGLIAPTPWYESFDYETYPQYRQYVQLLHNVAKRYSIPFLNLFEVSNLRPWEATFKANYFKNGDGVHPNTNGHRRFAGFIAEFLRSLIFPASTY